jgi:hypothetical protein
MNVVEGFDLQFICLLGPKLLILSEFHLLCVLSDFTMLMDIINLGCLNISY